MRIEVNVNEEIPHSLRPKTCHRYHGHTGVYNEFKKTCELEGKRVGPMLDRLMIAYIRGKNAEREKMEPRPGAN